MERMLPDILTGEVVDVFDPMIPLNKKIDPLVYYIDQLDSEIELCKERKSLWEAKRSQLAFTKEKVREFMLEQVNIHGKQKTLEANVYTTEKTKEVYLEHEDKPEYFDYSITIRNLDLQRYTEIKTLLESNDISFDTSAAKNFSKLPSEYKSTHTINQLTIRKSKTSSE